MRSALLPVRTSAAWLSRNFRTVRGRHVAIAAVGGRARLSFRLARRQRCGGRRGMFLKHRQACHMCALPRGAAAHLPPTVAEANRWWRCRGASRHCCKRTGLPRSLSHSCELLTACKLSRIRAQICCTSRRMDAGNRNPDCIHQCFFVTRPPEGACKRAQIRG